MVGFADLFFLRRAEHGVSCSVASWLAVLRGFLVDVRTRGRLARPGREGRAESSEPWFSHRSGRPAASRLATHRKVNGSLQGSERREFRRNRVFDEILLVFESSHDVRGCFVGQILFVLGAFHGVRGCF